MGLAIGISLSLTSGAGGGWLYPRYITVDGKQMLAYLPNKPYAFNFTEPDIYEFELHPGDLGRFTQSFDTVGIKHRSELSQNNVGSFDFGVPVWFATKHRIRDDLSGFVPNGQNVVFQFHGVDNFRSPPFGINITNNRVQIQSQSDSGGFLLLSSGVLPTLNEDEELVGKITFAEAGRCEIWRQGDKIVDYTGPIGWYSDIPLGKKAAYAQFGLYSDDVQQINRANRHASPRWGLTDLSARIVDPDGYGPNLALPLSSWVDASTAPSTITIGTISIAFNVSGGQNARARKSMTTEIGATYRVRRSDGNKAPLAIGTTAGAGDIVNFGTALQFTFVATTTTTWINCATSGTGTTLDAISCRKVL